VNFSFLETITPKQRMYVVFGFFVVLSFLFYGNTLQNGFVYDDHQVVANNPYIQSFGYLPKVVTSCTLEYAQGQCEGRTDYYRPIQSLSYLLTWQISTQPWFFHFVNIIYFAAVVFLVFLLAKTLTNNILFSFVAAFLFLIHPIHSEVANWISGIPDLSFALFALLSTIFYIQHRKEAVSSASWLQQYRKFMLAALFFFLALLSKEPAVLLPLVFLFLDLAFFKIKFLDLLRPREIVKYGSLGLLFFIYLAARIAVIGGISMGGEGYYGPFSFLERIVGSFTLFSQYIQKVIFPYPLHFFYSFEKTSDILSIQFVSGFLMFATFIGLFFYFVMRGRKLLSFAFLWFFLFLSPVILFFSALGDSLFSERYLLVPTVGYVFILSYGFVYVWQKDYEDLKAQKLARGALIGLLLIAMLSSLFIVWDRNQDWKNNETFFETTLSQNPDAHSLRFNLSVARRQEGDSDASKQELEYIEGRNPKSGERPWDGMIMVYLHLGDYYRDRGENIPRAFEYYQKSITVAHAWDGDWKGHFAYNRIGSLFAANEEYLGALPYFCQGVQLFPESETSQENFERILATINEKYQEDPAALYNDLISEKGFLPSEEERIQYVRRACDEDRCSFFFSFQSAQSQIIIPFLIFAATEQGEVVELQGSAYNPILSEAALHTDLSYADTPLVFIFPTCDGVYYETSAIVDS